MCLTLFGVSLARWRNAAGQSDISSLWSELGPKIFRGRPETEGKLAQVQNNTLRCRTVKPVAERIGDLTVRRIRRSIGSPDRDGSSPICPSGPGKDVQTLTDSHDASGARSRTPTLARRPTGSIRSQMPAARRRGRDVEGSSLTGDEPVPGRRRNRKRVVGLLVLVGDLFISGLVTEPC